MKKVGQLLVSGLIGIGIGMTWIVVQILLQYSWNNLANGTLQISDFLFWILESFLIGIFFCLAGWIFNNESWSLRKQIIINFFVCLAAWLVFNLFVDGAAVMEKNWAIMIGNFILMYVIAYGVYFFHLWNEVKQINIQLKKNKE
ncbi:DUF3021 domain-containing protein [Lactobacillus johnsonii]|uniref:DUF3021 domain-containing protein n=1 Tax=Lactobacillus johnsonii TaxID=33959 RepID=UPI0028EDA03C|nr:DUF3021 domain-containing protein [Lactobacillus johnsonii]MDT9605263.1 DUF3021 domain-containing protein [Lactobacillus johnsonii]